MAKTRHQKGLYLSALLLAPIFAGALFGSPTVQDNSPKKKPAQCEQSPAVEQNWISMGQEYVFFDYTLCPADQNPAHPFVRVWLTTHGDGIALEKWASERDGTDNVSVFHGKKKAYTIYRDLNAVPLSVFKTESRARVPDDMRSQPFMVEGTNLIPMENLMPESAERVTKAFENSDILIKHAEHKGALIRETLRIAAIVDCLDNPLKAKN